jgi:hypothetical protein
MHGILTAVVVALALVSLVASRRRGDRFQRGFLLFLSLVVVVDSAAGATDWLGLTIGIAGTCLGVILLVRLRSQ